MGCRVAISPRTETKDCELLGDLLSWRVRHVGGPFGYKGITLNIKPELVSSFKTLLLLSH